MAWQASAPRRYVKALPLEAGLLDSHCTDRQIFNDSPGFCSFPGSESPAVGAHLISRPLQVHVVFSARGSRIQADQHVASQAALLSTRIGWLPVARSSRLQITRAS